MSQKYSLLNEDTPYYKYNLSNVLENSLVCLDWDRGIVADKTVPHNHSDIILFEETYKIVYLLDVGIRSLGNL